MSLVKCNTCLHPVRVWHFIDKCGVGGDVGIGVDAGAGLCADADAVLVPSPGPSDGFATAAACVEVGVAAGAEAEADATVSAGASDLPSNGSRGALDGIGDLDATSRAPGRGALDATSGSSMPRLLYFCASARPLIKK